MKYSFKCPYEGCTFTAEVEESSPDAANLPLAAAAMAHGKVVHPDKPSTEGEVLDLVAGQLKGQ